MLGFERLVCFLFQGKFFCQGPGQGKGLVLVPACLRFFDRYETGKAENAT